VKGDIMKNRILKLAVTFALAISIAFCLGMSALADVLYIPPDEEDFYEAHREEMDVIGRQFYTNGATGYTAIYDKPDGKIVGYAQNGQKFYVMFTYANKWNMVEYNKDSKYLHPISGYSENSKVGYISVGDMLEVYDTFAFSEEHSAELEDYVGDLSELSEGAVLWAFPRSGDELGVMDGEQLENIVFDAVYTYPDGQRWAMCGYHYGFRNFWICLSDPLNESIPAELPDVPDFIQPQGDAPSVSGGISPLTLAAILVAAVVVVTLVVIILMKNKKAKD